MLLWGFFKSNPFQLTSMESTLPQETLARMRSELHKWYDEEQRQGRKHNRVQQLSDRMVGSADDPDLKLHAAETNGLVHFFDSFLDSFGNALDPGRRAWFRRGLSYLLVMLRIVRDFKTKVPPLRSSCSWIPVARTSAAARG